MVWNVSIEAFWYTIDIFDSSVSLSNTINGYWRLKIIVVCGGNFLPSMLLNWKR